MKKTLILFIAITSFFVACNRSVSSTEDPTVPSKEDSAVIPKEDSAVIPKEAPMLPIQVFQPELSWKTDTNEEWNITIFGTIPKDKCTPEEDDAVGIIEPPTECKLTTPFITDSALKKYQLKPNDIFIEQKTGIRYQITSTEPEDALYIALLKNDVGSPGVEWFPIDDDITEYKDTAGDSKSIYRLKQLPL